MQWKLYNTYIDNNARKQWKIMKVYIERLHIEEILKLLVDQRGNKNYNNKLLRN